MRGRLAITLSAPRIRLFLRFILGVLVISISITASLLSITLFLLRDRFSHTRYYLRASMANEEDGFSCKLHVSDLPASEKSVLVRNLTSKSLIIIRSVLLLQRHGLYLKILFLKKCETNVSDVRLQIDLKQILCPVVKHIESDHCPWNWASGCAWSSFIATARLNFVPSNILASFHGIFVKMNFFSKLIWKSVAPRVTSNERWTLKEHAEPECGKSTLNRNMERTH
uniref:Reverse transcriptase n=1 Tax=Elaeophora elaphi TaxID=1147741 RepID=A0A0R3RSE9_9BILA